MPQKVNTQKKDMLKQLYLRGENKIDANELKLMNKDEKRRFNMEMILLQRQNIQKRFRRGFKRIICINHFGSQHGKEIDFNDFSFSQSIEQTTKTLMDDDDLQEMQMVNQRLQNANGKIADLETIDFILIMMENIKFKEFFGDDVSLLKTVKEWIQTQKKMMIQQTKEIDDIDAFIKSIDCQKMMHDPVLRIRILDQLTQMSNAIDGITFTEMLNKQMSKNMRVMQTKKFGTSTPKTIQTSSQSDDESLDEIDNQILNMQAKISNQNSNFNTGGMSCSNLNMREEDIQGVIFAVNKIIQMDNEIKNREKKKRKLRIRKKLMKNYVRMPTCVEPRGNREEKRNGKMSSTESFTSDDSYVDSDSRS